MSAIEGPAALAVNLLSLLARAALLIGCLSVLGLGGLVLWHEFSPSGAMTIQSQRIAAIADAHAAGDHDAVVAIYETPMDIVAAPNVNWIERRGLFHHAPTSMMLQVADSYEHTGDDANAGRQYLLALGITPERYLAFCAERASCPDLDSLREWAEFRSAYAAER